MKPSRFYISAFISLTLFAGTVFAAPHKESGPTATKTGIMKSHSFDSHLVEGQIYRPDLSVVRGDVTLGGFGVLRLRNNFVDRVLRETS